MLCYDSGMTIDNFRHHSDDWSKVPRPEALQPMIRLIPIEGPMVQPDADLRMFVARAPAVQYVRVKPALSVGVAYVLWLLFGLLGAHYFYIGKPMIGVLWLLTGGLLGIGWIVDLFTLKGQVERANRY